MSDKKWEKFKEKEARKNIPEDYVNPELSPHLPALKSIMSSPIMKYGGMPKFQTAGQVKLYSSDDLFEEDYQTLLNAGRRNDYGEVVVPDPTQKPIMQTQQGFDNYYSPEESINRAADMIGTGSGTATIMPGPITPYIDEKTERGQSYIDPLAMYNFSTQGFRNKEMRDQKNRNNLLMYGEMANQPIDVKRNQNPYAFNTGQPLDNTLTNNQPIQSMAKRGGVMGKYKAGGTYMLEEDVINKIKAAGGIIKFLD
jgi:hypothetical protein